LTQPPVETPQAEGTKIDYTIRNKAVKVKASKRAMKYVDAAVCYSAGVAFDTLQFLNRFKINPSFTPKWTEKPLLKSWEKTKPALGWPRQTDSLCPECVKEAREKIMSNTQDWTMLLHEKVGEIKAQIIERDGQVWMVKDCPQHGHFEDLMRSTSISSSGSKRISPAATSPRTMTKVFTTTVPAASNTAADPS